MNENLKRSGQKVQIIQCYQQVQHEIVGAFRQIDAPISLPQKMLR